MSGSWSKIISPRTTRVFREYALRGGCTASTLSISRFCTACTPSISCFDTAGTYLPVLSGFRTAHTFSTLSNWALSVLAICGPSQYSQYFGRQYSYTLSTRTTNCSRASPVVSVKPLFYPERQENIFFAGICFVCAGFYSADHKVLCRNLDLTQL